jgi:hypothetical protein
MQADQVRENREALADYAAELINNPATSSFYQKPAFSQQEVEQQVERSLENEVIYPEPSSSVEENGDSDVARSSSVNDSSSLENYQVESYSLEQCSSQQEENKYSEDPLDIFEDAVNEGLFEEEPSKDTDSINNSSSLSDSSDNKDNNAENTDTKNSKSGNDDDDDGDGSNESGSNEPDDNEPSDDLDKSDPDNSINRSLLIANVTISLIKCIFGDDDNNHHDDSDHHL